MAWTAASKQQKVWDNQPLATLPFWDLLISHHHLSMGMLERVFGGGMSFPTQAIQLQVRNYPYTDSLD